MKKTICYAVVISLIILSCIVVKDIFTVEYISKNDLPALDIKKYKKCKAHFMDFQTMQMEGNNSKIIYFIDNNNEFDKFVNDAKKLRIKYNNLLKDINEHNKNIKKSEKHKIIISF
jgi:peptidoglycan hydrolase CwlO-like protein